MELVEIIKSSLSIFITAVIFFISISYTIFKIKNRSRTKLNLDVNLQNNRNGLINPNNEDRYSDKIVLTKHPVQNRFTIINEDMVTANSDIKEYINENPAQKLIPNIGFKNNYAEKINKLDPIFR